MMSGAPSVKRLEVINVPFFRLAIRAAIPINVMHELQGFLGTGSMIFAYLTDVKTIAESEILKLKI
jgi:phosphoribosyl 1,2-cyclic phosphate phosphodiesterase